MASESPASPLLRVKQTIPPARPGVVPRSRLERRLDEATTKLTTVVAPAGWGKTSLLSRWAAAAGSHVAWVSLDDSDDEPVRFWSYVLTALQQAGDDVTSAALDALRASNEGPMSLALPILLNELAAAANQHVLVLDDYHVIGDREVHESVEFLVAYLPPALRLVVASRMDPPLPLARMRVRGELTELRADDLRFSLDESAALVSAVAAAEPDPATVTAVWERTEGWAAGLQLAGLTLRGGSAVPSGDRHLFDYVEAEVFPALAPEQRALLVRTSSLELLSGSLCDAALDVRGSAAVLAGLEQASLFVVALDGEREWYRCHRLLRDALLRESRSDEAVLRRAAGWFERHGRTDDAVRHLLAAGDDEEAARLLRSAASWFLRRGWAATYLALGERLPDAVVNPNLALSLTYAAYLCGRRDRAAHWLDLCERGIDADTVIENWRSPRAAALSFRGLVATSPADPATDLALCERAVELESAAGAGDSPVVQIPLGRAYGLAGRFDDGVRILADMWRRRDRYTWWQGVDMQVASLLGLYLLQLGRTAELDDLLVEAAPVADAAERAWGEAAAPTLTILRLVEGRRSYQRGDLDEARARLGRGLALAEIAGRALYRVIGLVFLGDLELASGHRAAARATLVRAREVVDNEPVTPFVVRWLDEAQARIGRAAARAATDDGALYEQLTDRELSILRLLPGAGSQREIGAALFLSINTVKAYNKSLYRKLGVGSRQEAVDAARGLGLI